MTTSSLGLVPNQEKTPRRSVRVDDELWQDAQFEAERRGETVSDAVRRALREYVSGGLR